MKIALFLFLDSNTSKTNRTIDIHKSMMYENGIYPMDKNQRDRHELYVFCVAFIEEWKFWFGGE